ncbi:galectin 17 isoform X1 [Chelmon rostratus]|uniref:galectin 17 isoform X1 n=1 Tax=Chelmon rostratus TaxID=109905 RepID=UPI001BED054F|nr:galectin 17 isoform X1 [Chelmon rostratus]
MNTVRQTRWFLALLRCLLVGTVIDSSSPSSIARSRSVISTVGNQAVLPCNWKSRLGEEAPPTCHIQWTTPADTVFELRGEHKWQAEEFEGRVEVPEESLGSGDCSLIISDVQIGDAGRYESFMVVDGVKSTKTRVFIQSVKLSVFDHKSLQSRGPGEDLVLDLYTQHSLRVVFQSRSQPHHRLEKKTFHFVLFCVAVMNTGVSRGRWRTLSLVFVPLLHRNSSQWSDLWMRGDEDSHRLEKHPEKEQLTVKRLHSSDEGTYKVLDEYGLAVSTVQLAVEESSTARRVHVVLDHQTPAGDAARSSCSALLLFWSLLVTSLQTLHLL